MPEVLDPPQKPKAKKADRVFVTLKPISGFPTVGHKFSESQFRDLFPTKGVNQEHTERILAQIDPETYHDALLDSLMARECIAVAPEGSVADSVPPTPHSLNMNATHKNQTIAQATADYRTRKQRRAENIAADVAAYKAGLQDGAGEGRAASVPTVRRAVGSA
jgi:hypothetical protein